ncbi:nitroreductase family protein [Vibrio cholerae]|nr:nitroreductase family protein [Vibrio cholerae]
MLHSIKQMVPLTVKEKIRAKRKNLSKTIMRLFSKSQKLSALYYLIFNNNFNKEMQSVLKGNIKFDDYSKSPKSSSPQLRRNIHRLEKGLSMPERRNIFGEAFIIETVKLYIAATKTEAFSKSELEWAFDVLETFFSQVGSSEVIDFARELYVKNKICLESDLTRVPYKKEKVLKSDISYDDLLVLAKQRSSVRWYLDKEVPDELLNKAIALATTAPSACNRQPFEFLVINDKNKAKEVVSCPAGTAGFSNQVPCTIVVVGNLSCYPTPADRHVIYIDAALASMQLMLALETLGLSSCPINWPENTIRENLLKNHVNLPDYKRVIMMISVGYGDEKSFIPFSSKKTVNELRTSIESYS